MSDTPSHSTQTDDSADDSGPSRLGMPQPPPPPLASVYPRKLFYRIQEVADIVGVEPYVLRYWETKFPMLQPEKDAADQRRYRQRDIDLLLKIRDLLYAEKYTIAGAVEKLRLESPGRGRPATGASPSLTTGRMLNTPDLFASMSDPDKTPSSDALLEPTPLPLTMAENLPWSPDSESNARRGDLVERLRAELGLLKRELMEWRDELA